MPPAAPSDPDPRDMEPVAPMGQHPGNLASAPLPPGDDPVPAPGSSGGTAPGPVGAAAPAPQAFPGGQSGDPGAGLWAGVAKADITDYAAGPAHDPLYVKALVLKTAETAVAIVTIDAVALAEIGPVPAGFLPTVQRELALDPGLAPGQLLVNASHCHGLVCAQVAERTVETVRRAWQSLVPVRAGVGVGHEDRISENRRLQLTDGREADVRHAYSLAPDAALAGVGPIDPQIGLLRLDRLDGSTLAVVYNFAVHPIQGVPSGANTADVVGFASAVIEAGTGPDCLALFLQGCAGDVNPVRYKDVDHPRDAAPLGHCLGLAALQALKQIRCGADARLCLATTELGLPRADLRPAIAALEAAQATCLASLTGTTLNLKTFLQLTARYGLDPEFPSCYGHRYLHDRSLGRAALDRLDADNRRHLAAYRERIYAMEELTRIAANLELLRLHHARNQAASGGPLTVELLALRVAGFVLVTFPGELSAQIGLNLKAASPHPNTFVAAYTNGYIYYAPTAAQLRNRGWAQEDSDCELDAAWQARFEAAALRLLGRLHCRG